MTSKTFVRRHLGFIGIHLLLGLVGDHRVQVRFLSHGRHQSPGAVTEPNGCTAQGTSPAVLQPFGKAPRAEVVGAGELDGLAVMKVDFVQADGADHFKKEFCSSGGGACFCGGVVGVVERAFWTPARLLLAYIGQFFFETVVSQ